jgi:iron(III) transport system permease protein
VQGALMTVAAFLVVVPLLLLLYAAVIDVAPRPGHVRGGFTLDNLSVATGATTRNAALNSLRLAGGGTLLAFVIGAGLAWLAARTDVPGRSMVELAGITPLFMSSLVAALAWAFLAAPRAGVLNIALADLGLKFRLNIYTLSGIIFIFGIYYAPYIFLFFYGALNLMNTEMEQAAQVHGAGVVRYTWAITLPLAMPALMGGSLLAFALMMENFPVPELLATPRGIDTLPSLVYRLMNMAPPSSNLAAAIGVVLLVIMLLVIALQRRIIARRDFASVGGKGLRRDRLSLGPWRWVAFTCVLGYLLLAVVLPFGALALMTFREHTFVVDLRTLFDPSGFSFRHLVDTWSYAPFSLSLHNSLITAAATALVGGTLHFFMAYVVYRTAIRGRQFLEYFGMAPMAIPSIVLGLGFLWTWYALPIPVFGTLAVLVLAYVARFMPQGFRGVAASLLQIDRELEEAAIVSGASKARTVSAVTLPLMRGGLVGTALLLLILSMRELTAVIFLVTAGTPVLAVAIFRFWESGLVSRAAAASLIYSAILVCVTLFARRWLRALE